MTGSAFAILIARRTLWLRVAPQDKLTTKGEVWRGNGGQTAARNHGWRTYVGRVFAIILEQKNEPPLQGEL